jgi:exonuclease I
MHAVFYDLETSDRNSIGQIINYSFIFFDSAWNLIDECSGLVKLSRLQVPDAGAILANRTNVLDHQGIAQEYEPAAMDRISKFLAGCIEKAQGAVALIGYNSSRFDLGYLRTSLIRNGINPYFGGKVTPRDLLHVVQKAYLVSAPFRELVRKQRSGEKRLSLSLQTVGHALGLLSGVQAHESREDVLLTVRVAEWLRDNCDLDTTTFEAYEGGKLHSTARSGAVYMVEEPDYDMEGTDYVVKRPVTLLDATHRAALWIDLERYLDTKDPSCIMWRSAGKNAFFVSGTAETDPELQRTARAAIAQFKTITLKNFFQRTTCDIELDIYRLDFDQLDLFTKAIETNDKSVLQNCPGTDAKVLWLRRQLGNPNADISDPKTAEMLRKYALHRYGGKLQLARSVQEGRKEAQREGIYHATLGEMVRELIQRREAAELQKNYEDQALLDALETFIRRSDIAKVAGKELIPMWVA